MPKAPKRRMPIKGPAATPTVPAVTYTDMPRLRRQAGSSSRTSSAPRGWNAPDPRPEARASATRRGKLLTKPTTANVTAVHASASPVNRVPKRSAMRQQRLRDRGHAAVRKADQPNGGEAQVEPADQQRIQDGDDADVAVDGEVAEHEGQRPAVAA